MTTRKHRLKAPLGVAVAEITPLSVCFGLSGAVVKLADGWLEVNAAAPRSARTGNFALGATSITSNRVSLVSEGRVISRELMPRVQVRALDRNRPRSSAKDGNKSRKPTIDKKNRPGQRRAGLPCETSRALKGMALTAGFGSPPHHVPEPTFFGVATGPSKLCRTVSEPRPPSPVPRFVQAG
jgi:hypothetical protein